MPPLKCPWLLFDKLLMPSDVGANDDKFKPIAVVLLLLPIVDDVKFNPPMLSVEFWWWELKSWLWWWLFRWADDMVADDDEDAEDVLWCARLCVDSGGEFVLLFPGGHNLKLKKK